MWMHWFFILVKIQLAAHLNKVLFGSHDQFILLQIYGP